MAENKQLLQPTTADHVHVLVKAVISAVPVVGSPAAELFGYLIAPPLNRRRDEWLESLAQGFALLEERFNGFDHTTLADREEFVSAVLQATQTALRTHHKEHREALRNALLNIAIGREPDEDMQAMFLGHIDTLTTWHIRVLKFFESPPIGNPVTVGTRAFMISSSPGQALENHFSDLQGRQEFYEQLVKDLVSRGFMSIGENMLQAMMTPAGVSAKRTSEMGDRFLKFISEPA